MSVLDLNDVITMYKYYIYYSTICNTFKKKGSITFEVTNYLVWLSGC